jgi:hypothetical protein
MVSFISKANQLSLANKIPIFDSSDLQNFTIKVIEEGIRANLKVG